MSISPGTRLGPYAVEEAVGAGGMGEVYKAVDTRLDRTVAIKVLPSHLADHPELKQRLDREARAISSLQHPNICALFDIGHEGDVDFLVMEYLEGDTLADRLREGPLATNEVLGIGAQVADALQAAHKRGVVHRDLKPGNIMVTKTGVKLLDFGLAKTAEGGAATTDSSLTQLATQVPSGEPLTEKGTVLGTFQYMAPEQLEGGEADARTDIFALGAVLYEMATGRKAFEGKSQASLIASIMQAQPAPISTVQPMTPPALDRVIRTCLAKDPDDRWQTAHDVALQLKWIEEGGSQLGIPRPVAARRRHRERTAWIVAGVAVVAAVVLGGWTLMRPTPEAPGEVRFEIQAPHAVQSFGSPRISPDGRYIVFNGVDSTGTSMLWLRPLDALEANPIPGTEGCTRPFWSPDSKNIAFFAAGKLKRVPVTGGPPFTICEYATGSDGTWGTDGTILFDASAGDSLHAVSAGGGVPTGATRLDRSRHETGSGWPCFLPDGRRFLYIAFVQDQPPEIRLGTLGTFESKRLTAGDSRAEYVAPGYIFYERNGTLLAQPFDAGKGEITGDPFPLAEGIGTGAVGLAHFSASRNGTLIYTSGDPVERQLVWFDRQGHELGTVGKPGQYSQPALSPDAQRLAVARDDPRSNSPDVWLIDLRRGTESRFTFDPGSDDSPVWSPDGRRIAYSSGIGGKRRTYVKDASGAGTAQEFSEKSAGAHPSDWSRDGTTLCYYAMAGSTSLDVMTVPASGDGTPRAVVATKFVDAQGTFSPDGRYVAYTSSESGHFEIYLTTRSAGGGKWQVSVDGGTEPFWRADGKEMYFLSLDRRLTAVDVSLAGGVEIGVPHKLFTAPVPRDINTRNRYVPAPDGKRFLMLALMDRGRVPPTTVVLHWNAQLHRH